MIVNGPACISSSVPFRIQTRSGFDNKFPIAKNDQSCPSVHCSLRSTHTGWMQLGIQYRDRAVRESADTRRDGDRRLPTRLGTVERQRKAHLRKKPCESRDVSDIPE